MFVRLLVTAVAGLLLAGTAYGAANCVPGSPQPLNQVCTPAGKVCGADSPCSCPSNARQVTGNPAAADYDCIVKGGLYKCPPGGPITSNKDASDAGLSCAGTSVNDPLVSGFDGCSWYMKGQAGTVVNLITEANHVVNTLLVPANLTDDHHNNDGTFHGAVSVRYRNVVVTGAVDPQGNLTVTLDDEAVPFEAIRKQDGLTLKVSQFQPYYGQVAEISTPAFRFFLHAVQPYNTSAGWSRGHLDFSATMLSGVSAHGLLGQTVPHAGSTCPDHFDFAGEGTEEDYLVSDLQAVNFEYNLFSGQAASRRLHMAELAHEILVSELTAFSRGFY